MITPKTGHTKLPESLATGHVVGTWKEDVMASKEAIAAANRHLRSLNLDPDLVNTTRDGLAKIIDEEFAEREGLIAANVKLLVDCWMRVEGQWLAVPNTGKVLIELSPKCLENMSLGIGMLAGMMRYKKEVKDDANK